MGTTNAGGSLRRLVRIGLQPRNQAFQVSRRHRILCNDEPRTASEPWDGLEIIQHVVLERVDGPVDNVGAQEAGAERVAITCRARDAADAKGPSGATYVFNDDGLTEPAPHALGHDARDCIQWPARPERYNNRHGT